MRNELLRPCLLPQAESVTSMGALGTFVGSQRTEDPERPNGIRRPASSGLIQRNSDGRYVIDERGMFPSVFVRG